MKGQAEIISRNECLQVALLTSPHASASIVRKSATAVNDVESGVRVFFAEDLVVDGQPALLARERVDYYGQIVGVVVGKSRASCLEGLDEIEIEYHATPGVLDVAHAKAVRSALGEEFCLQRGNVDRELEEGELRVEGCVSIGSQYPVSCGILVVTAEPSRDNLGVNIQVPTENPSLVRAALAKRIGLAESQVKVSGLPVRGISGGRGAESVQMASLVAVVAMKLGKSVRMELDAEQEIVLTGKRHGVEADFRVDCDKNGVILSADINLTMDGGTGNEEGPSVLKRMMLNIDGAYGISEFRARGRLCRTNGLTGDSIAAEGSAQGVLVMEEIIASVARASGVSTETVRELNFYRSKKEAAMTPYGQKVDAELLSRLWIAMGAASKFHQRKEEIEKWNQKNHACKRGIATVPIKMGIGDPLVMNNRASVWVQVYSDASVGVRIGRVDTGDGLLLRVKKQVSKALGVKEEAVEVRGSEEGDLNESLNIYGVDEQAMIGRAVEDACDQLSRRLREGKESNCDGKTSFEERVVEAGNRGENLTASGFYQQSGMDWDEKALKGSPFGDFFYGGAVIEVEMDAFTGEVQVIRADLFAAGVESDFPDLDRAQIARAYMLGQGWMLNENVNSRPLGVPGIEEAPIDFRIELIDVEGGKKKHQRSVSCAEAPVAMAVATRQALKEAIFADAPRSRFDIDLPVPSSPDAVMCALREVSRKTANLDRKRKKSGKKA